MDTETASRKLERTQVGVLKGHRGEVTSLVTGFLSADAPESRLLVSGGRDRRVLIWRLATGEGEATRGQPFGEALQALTGHGHFISDLVLTRDNQNLFSSSWDRTLRHWDMRNGACLNTFAGARKELTSVALSNDSRKIFTGGLENAISLWNTKGAHMEDSGNGNHQDWVGRVRYSPSGKNEYLATVGWDGRLKVWTGNFHLKSSFVAHSGPATALAIAYNGLFIATGGRDQFVRIWNLRNLRQPVQSLKRTAPVNDIAFNPHIKIFAVASDADVAVFSLADGVREPHFVIELEQGQRRFASLAWSADGKYLFCGCGNGDIVAHHVWLA